MRACEKFHQILNEVSSLDGYTAESEISHQDDEALRDFTFNAVSALKMFGEQALESQGIENDRPFFKGVDDWIQDSVHGVEHSYRVYQKAIELKRMDPENSHIDERYLMLMAIIHDLAEFLPLYSPDDLSQPDADKDERWKSQNHPRIMAALVRKIGENFGIKDSRQLARDILYHDFYWEKPSLKRQKKIADKLSSAGKILADADKLVANSSNPSHREAAENAIERCFSYGVGREYLIRPDLTKEERDAWWPRSVGLFDGLTVVLQQFNAPDHAFFTEQGGGQYQDKKGYFKEALEEVSRRLYRASLDAIQQTQEQGQSLQWGIKGGNPEIHGEVQGDIREFMERLINTPVEGKSEKGRDYYGYSIKAGDEWIDPSIARYASEEDLISALLYVVDEYNG